MNKREINRNSHQEITFQYKKVMNAARNRKEYFVFNGKDLASARLFLQNNPVSSRSVYLVVQTPAGTLCADADGIEQIPVMDLG